MQKLTNASEFDKPMLGTDLGDFWESQNNFQAFSSNVGPSCWVTLVGGEAPSVTVVATKVVVQFWQLLVRDLVPEKSI